MANISNFVNVTISIQDLTTSQDSFGTILYLGNSAVDQAAVYTFTADPDGLQAYLDAGGDADDPFYKDLSAIAGQPVHVPSVKFYSRGTGAATHTYTLTPINVVEGREYRLLVNGVEVSYTADSDDDDEAVAAALDTLIEAVDGAASSVTTNTITVTAESEEGVYLDQVDPSRFTLNVTTADSSIDDDLAAAAALDNDWYGLLIDSQGDTDIADAAAYAQANRKLFLGQTFDADSLAGNGVLATLFTAAYSRTGLLIAGDTDNKPSAALLGRQFALPPGASAFGKKNLEGVSADALTPTHYANVTAKNGITYTNTRGINFTSHGKAISGRQLHVTRDIDWLQFILERNVLLEMVNSEKIEMSDKGITQIEKAVRAAMLEAETAGAILAGWSLTVPKAADLATADVNAGIVRGIKFKAASGKGAEQVIINGTVI